MHQVKKLTDDLYWVGGNDRRLTLFENAIPVPRGISYNAYFIDDEKTTLLDTVDRAVAGVFFENLDFVLRGRALDYVVVTHMEPDHCAMLGELVRRWPDVVIVVNQKSAAMIRQFFTFDIDARARLVSEGDALETGKHTLRFYMAPMVHWPEVMVAYDETDHVLYSADAFGTFGALSGNIFADELDFERDFLSEARRYYANIVGKYGAQTTALLKKAAGLSIALLCPLHGPVWRKNIPWYVEKYVLWGAYAPEEQTVMIAYASVYGDTENAAEIFADALAARGVRGIALYDVSVTHPSVIVSEAFRCSHLAFLSTTYNAGVFIHMETALRDIAAHNLQNRTVALVENGSWAPASGKLMREILSKLKNVTILEDTVTLKSSVKQEQHDALVALAGKLADTMQIKAPAQTPAPAQVENRAFFAISYGLFLLTARDGARNNGCIVNTVNQVTDTPKRIAVAVNKLTLTHDMIKKTGEFNVSVLTTATPFDIFRHFGFQSGHSVDKFAAVEGESRSQNGLIYLADYSNAYLSAKVISAEDLGTHTLFTAEVTEAAALSDAPSVTYQYYIDHIKPKPTPGDEQKKGFVCRVCGYVYEGDTLPPDFICPICKHTADVFEPIG